MAIQSKASLAVLSPERRQRLLERVSRLGIYWILAVGALHCFGGEWTSAWLRLRYSPYNYLVFRGMGAAWLCLGLFLRAQLKDPRNQYLAVDTLTVFFGLQVFFLAQALFSHYEILVSEWAAGLVQLALFVFLALSRTRGSAMAKGAPGSTDYRDAAKETVQKLKTLTDRRKPQGAGGRRSEAAPSLD